MRMRKKGKGPRFVRYFGPLIVALKELGGSGTPSEVTDIIARDLSIPEAEQNEVLKSGALRFVKDVAFARQYLVWRGLLSASTRGIWILTDKGRELTNLGYEESLRIFKEEHQRHSNRAQPKKSKPVQITDEDMEEEQDEVAPELRHRAELLAVLRRLPPSGFENLCKRLLREAGFEKVTVTGGPKDKGIDGFGILQLNPLVSFKILFQCKRYSGSVSRSEIGDFRNAMMGRAEKGIFITTGTFTADARAEAVRDGVSPIELVDADKLLDMFEQLELGLKPHQVYEIDFDFFANFGAQGDT